MLKRLLDKLSGLNTLYYPGCMTAHLLPHIQRRYEGLLRAIGTDFIVLPQGEIFCCGSPVHRAGYPDDFHHLRDHNLEVFHRFSVKRIISNCPACVYTFKEFYHMESWHVAEVVFRRGRRISSRAPTMEDGTIAYHHPCHMSRYLEVKKEPLEILRRHGYNPVEVGLDGNPNPCCGAGGGLQANEPDLAGAIAQDLLAGLQQNRLVTSCPLCYMHLQRHAGGIKVIELGELLE
ncbi:MAG: (Fe-S)-binding protein [Deltaproteobacteria bacterium]|nr:(Fe-S)-binding protein [Deltaproteobacteria bacterium]